jgi:hypothetical protein
MIAGNRLVRLYFPAGGAVDGNGTEILRHLLMGEWERWRGSV